jgi:hypothetical protein
MAGTTGLGTSRHYENAQVIDYTRRQNRQNSYNRSTQVHGGYTALFLASVLPPFPISATFKLFEQCLLVATFLCLIAIPLALIGREKWKERVR